MPLTDLALNSEALVIKNETILRANTAIRVGTMLQHLIDNKINNDKIDTNPALGTSNTSIPSQAAVRSYVDNNLSTSISNLETYINNAIDNLVPYTGATQNVNLSAYNLNAGNGYFSEGTVGVGDAGNITGYIVLSTVASNFGGRIKANDANASLITSTLPSVSGTLANTSDIPVVPKRFIALISQSGTANPTLTIVRNDFAGTVSVTRNAAGDYTVINTLPEFILNKTTACINNSTNYAVKFTGATRTANTTISLAVFNITGSAADTLLLGDVLQIEVYP